ncbi:hypothetical protein EJB05_37278, partial [Eragrostis curvula]
MEPSVHDVLTFHRIDRAAYDRLVALGAGRQPASDAVALLMWLHRRACARVDAAARVLALVRDPTSAALLVAEARAVLDGAAFACAMTMTTTTTSATPLISCLCGEDDARVRRFLLLLASCAADVDAPRRGVAEILHGVGALVFDDRLHALMRRHEEDGCGELPAELAAPYRRCCSTSAAAAAAAAEEEEDGRSLFITFSKGFPLTREEIIDFFTQYWHFKRKIHPVRKEKRKIQDVTRHGCAHRRWDADCVARVMMEKTPPGEPPTYGRIVFHRAESAAAVLGGRPLVKLVVNGRHLWARKYVPRPPLQL